MSRPKLADPRPMASAAVAAWVFLLFFRARWAFDPAWEVDDGCHFQHLAGWLGFEVAGACRFAVNHHGVGPSLLWLPVGAIGRIAAWIAGDPPEAWMVPLIALQSMALWGGALAFIRRIWDRLGPPPAAPARGIPSLLGAAAGPVGVLLCVPVLYYCVQRPLMAHAAEAFFCFGAVAAIVEGRIAASAALAVGACLCRINDVPLLLVVLAGALRPEPAPAAAPSAASPRSRAGVWALKGGAAAAIAWGAWVALVRGYQGKTVFTLLSDFRWGPAASFLWGGFGGTLWTAPWWLGSLAVGARAWPRLSWAARAALGWVAAEAGVCILWNGYGGDFAYRYLIGSYAGALLVWLEALRPDPSHGAPRRRIQGLFRGLTAANALLLTYLLIVYKTLPGTGAHAPEAGLENPHYIAHALQAPVLMPKAFKVAAVQQLPVVTLAISAWMRDRPGYDLYAIQGPGLALLALATSGAIALLLVRARSRRDP